ncbi:MAG: S41 family peptidase [Alphaproteobacteria bacterium]|nr:S41 family peptidase [Alphaproteobacteria bacterium]
MRSVLRRLPALRLFTVGLAAGALLLGCGVGSGPSPEARSAAEKLEETIVAMRRDAGATVGETPDTELFAQAFEYVRAAYVRQTEEQALFEAAADGMRTEIDDPRAARTEAFVEAATQAMLHSLDDYSGYLDRESFRRLQEETRGRFGGLGVEIKKDPLGLEVISPIDGTPAEAAGLRPGDKLTHADGDPLAPMTLREAVDLLRGDVGTRVTLTVEREGRPPFQVEIVRAVIRIQPVKARLEGDVGYLRVTHFVSRTGEVVREKMAQLEEAAGPGGVRGFVVDLRNNPGGLLDEAIDVSGAFLDGGGVVSVKSRTEAEAFAADGGDESAGKPIVVLINEGSASASEIVAGALKDRNRAVLVGKRTFGKGSVQTILPLPGQRGIKLTTALYFTPTGRTVEGGIPPHIEVARDPDAAEDAQLERALTLVIEMAGGHSIYWNAGAVQR